MGNPFRISEHVDLGDLPVVDREGSDKERPAVADRSMSIDP
jgi:hypothetical protein